MAAFGEDKSGGVEPPERVQVRRLRRWSLSAHLVALLVVFGLAAGAALAYGRSGNAHSAQDGALGDARFGAGLAARDIASELALVQGVVTQVAATPDPSQLLASTAGCNLSLRALGNFAAGHIDVVAADGRVACSSVASPGGYTGANWLPAAITTASMIGPLVDARTGQLVFGYVAPLGGHGAVVVFVNLASLGPTLSAGLGGPRGLEFVVTTADGRRVLTRSVNPARWVGADISGTAFDRSRGGSNHVDLDGVRRLYGSATVPGTGWVVYAGADLAAAVGPTLSRSDHEILITLLGLLVFVLVAAAISRRVTQPIKELRDAVRVATTQPAAIEVPVKGPAEVAALAEDVRTLVAAAGRELLVASRLSSIVDSSSDSIVGKTTDGTITSWNQAATSMYGYSADEAIGNNISMIVPVDRAGELRVVLARAARGESTGAFETKRLRKDGAMIDVSLSVSPIRDAAGMVVGASATARDITALKRADAQRRDLEERLGRSQRLESLGKLAGGIAHDFNNLLGVILNYAEFVAQATLDPEVKSDVAQIQQAAERGARLTRQLLVFGRRGNVKSEPLDVNAVLADMEQLLSRSIGEHLNLVTRPGSVLPAVLADRSQIEQVLLNLAVNARDAMPGGGDLTIVTRQIDLDMEYCRLHPDAEPGRFVELQVIDTGTGMEPEVAARIFEPFFTTKPEGRGTGLGLATVYGIVVGIGGSLAVDSQPGSGTTFHVMLPAVTAPAATATTPPPPAQGKGERILVVDDEPALLDVTARILRRNGYEVLEALTWDEAVAHSNDEVVDLLITDSVMPNMPGRDLAELLRDAHPGIGVLFMSGYGEEALEARGVQEGAPFIQKPFNEGTLLDKVRAVLDARRR